MKYTPENIIQNLENVGPWSSYYLAEIALQHYFPEECKGETYCEPSRMVELADELGCPYWQDLIIKYQNEVGYDAPDGFDIEYVNQH